jgi:hypothetical protein
MVTLSLSWNRLRASSLADVDRVLDHLERELDKLRDLHQVRYTSVIASDYRVKPGEFVLIDPRGGALSIFMPSAAANPDDLIVLRNVTSSTNAITIHAHPGESLDFASATATLTMSLASARVELLALRAPHSCYQRVH